MNLIPETEKYIIYDLLVKLANKDGRKRKEIFGNKEDNFYIVTIHRKDTKFSTFLNFIDDLGYEVHIVNKNDPSKSYIIDKFDPFKGDSHVKSY